MPAGLKPLKQEKYALDDEMLKPYFKLENVQKGIFDLAHMMGVPSNVISSALSGLTGVVTKENASTDAYYVSCLLYTSQGQASAGVPPRPGKQGWQELVRHRHPGPRPEHLPLHHKTSPGRVDPPGPSGEIGKIPGEQRVYFCLLYTSRCV